jgi:rod shape determining protein RodA
MTDRSSWRNFDWPLFWAVLILCGIGIGMIYSATFTTIDLKDHWLRQALFAGAGLVGLVVIALIDYRQLEILALPAFIIFVLSLVAVELFGESQGGSQRWINIGGTLVQPTESGKFFLIIFMAWYLSWYREYMDRLPYLIIALILLLAPLVLVYLQPNLGMTITYAFLGGTLILVSGVRYWQLGVLGAGAIAAVPLLATTLQGYMVERLCMFLDPQRVELLKQYLDASQIPDSCHSAEALSDAKFNVEQALIAVGSGDWLGQGWALGSQNQGHFLRVRHTDFIFSVIAEELGLVGAVIILFLLFFVVWRLLNIAERAQDHFGRLLATGVAAIIFFQTFSNVGMNIGLLPVTGLTLPFISYGGSSLVSMMFAVGLAESVIMRPRKIEFL